MFDNSAEQAFWNGVAADQITTMIKRENHHRQNKRRFWLTARIVLLVVAITVVLTVIAMKEGNYPSLGALFEAARDQLYQIT